MDQYELLIERYIHFAEDFGLVSYHHELHTDERKAAAKEKLLSKSIINTCKYTLVIKALTMSSYHFLHSQLILSNNEEAPIDIDYNLIKYN